MQPSYSGESSRRSTNSSYSSRQSPCNFLIRERHFVSRLAELLELHCKERSHRLLVAEPRSVFVEAEVYRSLPVSLRTDDECSLRRRVSLVNYCCEFKKDLVTRLLVKRTKGIWTDVRTDNDREDVFNTLPRAKLLQELP